MLKLAKINGGVSLSSRKKGQAIEAWPFIFYQYVISDVLNINAEGNVTTSFSAEITYQYRLLRFWVLASLALIAFVRP